jgi:hypothetical protein
MDYRKTTLENLRREDYQRAARINKAMNIAGAIDYLIDKGRMKLEDLIKASAQTRSLAAQIASKLRTEAEGSEVVVHPPSETTWAHAIRIYRRRIREKITYAQRADIIQQAQAADHIIRKIQNTEEK